MRISARRLGQRLWPPLLVTAAARLYRFACALSRARRHAHRAAAAKPVTAGDAPSALLLLGDSLAVGIGAGSPERTLGGQLARDFAGLGIECRARVGARAHDLPSQLEAASRDHYRAIVVCIGGNDVLRTTPLQAFGERLAQALAQCRARSSCLIVTNCANLGGAPLFFWPWNRWLDARSLRVRQVMARVCRRQDACFVNFCLERNADVFRRHPKRFFSADGIHPSAYAYRLCYLHIVRQARLGERLGE